MMITFKDDIYFLHLKELTDTDLEFNVTDSTGEIIGTSLTTLATGLINEDEIIHLDKIIENKCNQCEVEIRFKQEYKKDLQNLKLTAVSRDEIIDNLSKKWLLASNILNEHIPAII